jgi:hypothetical protein
MSGYAGIASQHSELIRKSLQGSVFVAPITAAAIDTSTLFDSVTGDLASLPAGYVDLGWTSDVGATVARKVASSDIMAWGDASAVRSDVTSDVSTLQVIALETKLETIGLYTGVAKADITPGVNGVTVVEQPSTPTATFYRLLVVGVDEGDSGEIVLARFLPRAQVTNYGNQVLSNGKSALEWDLTFTGYQDSVLGYAGSQIYGGAGWLALLTRMGLNKTVTCTVALTTALVATTGTFSAEDVGQVVSGVGLVGGQTIDSVTDATHAVLSAAGTVAGSGVAVTIHGS